MSDRAGISSSDNQGESEEPEPRDHSIRLIAYSLVNMPQLNFNDSKNREFNVRAYRNDTRAYNAINLNGLKKVQHEYRWFETVVALMIKAEESVSIHKEYFVIDFNCRHDLELTPQTWATIEKEAADPPGHGMSFLGTETPEGKFWVLHLLHRG